MKNLNPLFRMFLLTALSMTHWEAHAGNGSGTRGGETIDVTSSVSELRELSTSISRTGSCQLVFGKDILNRAPHFKPILEKLRSIDWYFAQAFEEELETLQFCFTGKLRKIRTENIFSLLDPLDPKAFSQVALRFRKWVLIDTSAFEKLRPEHRGYLIAHEIAHSFFSETAGLPYYMKIRTFVRTLRDMREGRVNTSEQFRKVMIALEIDFPMGTEFLTPYRTEIELLLGDSFEAQTALAKNYFLAQRIAKMPMHKLSPYLAQEHQWIANIHYISELLADSYSNACLNSTITEFSQFIQAESLNSLNPLAICVTLANRLTLPKQRILIEAPKFAEYLRSLVNQVVTNRPEIHLGTDLVTADPLWLKYATTDYIATPGYSDIPFSRLVPIPAHQIQLNTSYTTVALANAIRLIIENTPSPLDQKLLVDQANFGRAFRLTAEKQKVQSLPDSRRRERQLLNDFILPEIETSYQTALVKFISAEYSTATTERLKQLLQN